MSLINDGDYYQDFISTLVIDNTDTKDDPYLLKSDVNIVSANTLMTSFADKVNLAKTLLNHIGITCE